MNYTLAEAKEAFPLLWVGWGALSPTTVPGQESEYPECGPWTTAPWSGYMEDTEEDLFNKHVEQDGIMTPVGYAKSLLEGRSRIAKVVVIEEEHYEAMLRALRADDHEDSHTKTEGKP